MIGVQYSDHPLKLRRPRSRDVCSRFLSPADTPLPDNAVSVPSPNQAMSPIRRKPSVSKGRKNRSLEDAGALVGGLWPSSATSAATSQQVDSVASHFDKERLKYLAEGRKDEKSGNGSENALLLNRQRSCADANRFENDKERAKENHRPSFGGSARHTDKFRVLGKTSFNSSSFSSKSSSDMVPGRHSVDENVLFRKSTSRRNSDDFRDNLEPKSDNGSHKNPSFASYLASTVSSRNSGKEVSSKYLNDLQTRPRKGSSPDSDQHVSLGNSPKTKKISVKDATKRANSITGYGSASSQWALSPGRSGPPPTSVEHKGKLMSFSSLKSPSSPSKPKGVEKLWHFGVGLFKGNKSSSSSAPPLANWGPRFANVDAMHQLKLLHSREIQWRYANARADVVKENIVKHIEIKLVCAWDGLRKLQQSVLEKRVQLEKEKLKTKLKFILHSQMKVLETWGDMEMQHLSALSKTKECLHSAVYKVPLTQGAKMSPELVSVALVCASDLTASIHSTLTFFSPMVEETVLTLAELADVVGQEKLLLEECCELLRTISILEIKERSLQCSVVQLKSWQKQHQPEEQANHISF